MAKEQTDLNNAQVVVEQDLKKADAVNQQDLTAQAVTEQDDKLANGTSKSKTIKYSEFEKANRAKQEAEEAKKAAEEQAAHAQRQLELMQQQNALVNPSPEKPKTPAEQALSEMGITADELYGDALITFQNRKDQIVAQQAQQQQGLAMAQQFIVNHSDINEVVGNVNPATGQIVSPNAELLALLAKKPHLATASLETLYESVMDSRKISEYEKNQAALNEHQARQGIDNETAPLGGSAAGGGAGGDVQQPMMTREQVLEVERKLAAGEAV